MSATVLSSALLSQRDILAARWLSRFSANNAAFGRVSLRLPAALVTSLLDEVIRMIDSAEPSDISSRDHARIFAAMAGFPAHVAVCIDAIQAGAQVIGAFVVENAGPRAAWTNRVRNQFLGELDAIFHLLVRRELEALRRQQADAAEEGAANPHVGTSCAIPPAALLFSESVLLRN